MSTGFNGYTWGALVVTIRGATLYEKSLPGWVAVVVIPPMLTVLSNGREFNLLTPKSPRPLSFNLTWHKQF